MRVLFNTYPVAFDCPGGGEVQLLECRRALEALSVEVLLYDPWRPQFDQVDLVHYFSVQGGSMSFCDYVKRRGLPLLISPILWITPTNRPQLPWSEIRDLLHLADRVLPNSRAECEQLADEFGVESERFSPIPNGISAQFAERVDANLFRRRFELHEPFVLNVANIEPRKNQQMLARVARDSRRRLVLVGRARDQQYLHDVLAAGGDYVSYLGPLEHTDPLLRSAYAACRVFALPSLLETPGLAALEAAAQGARLVVTSEGSTHEYFGPHAAYVHPADPAGLHEAIDAQWLAPQGEQLRERVIHHFTWTKAAQALIDAYEQTLAVAGSVG